MKKHNHTKCLADAMQKAESICEQNNARLTPSRRRVLELIWQSHKAIKAYDLLEILQKEDKSAKPPTIYRALDFLTENGLVHKVESLNAYLGCSHPEQNGHSCQFFICRDCNDIHEFCDNNIFESINHNAEKIGFRPSAQTVEVLGICDNCGK
jgi:Fur family zinc uptake transcriptional regulator